MQEFCKSISTTEADPTEYTSSHDFHSSIVLLFTTGAAWHKKRKLGPDHALAVTDGVTSLDLYSNQGARSFNVIPKNSIPRKMKLPIRNFALSSTFVSLNKIARFLMDEVFQFFSFFSYYKHKTIIQCLINCITVSSVECCLE